MDLPDHLLEELDYLGDCITSCDKVENYLMRSEYENNLISKPGDGAMLTPSERRYSRLKRSFSVRQASILPPVGEDPMLPEPPPTESHGARQPNKPPSSLPPEMNNFNKYAPQRRITVIEEASVWI